MKNPFPNAIKYGQNAVYYDCKSIQKAIYAQQKGGAPQSFSMRILSAGRKNRG